MTTLLCKNTVTTPMPVDIIQNQMYNVKNSVLLKMIGCLQKERGVKNEDIHWVFK